MYSNFAFSCDLTHVPKCAIQTLAGNITGSRPGLLCFIAAIELSQVCCYAVMKGVFSFSFQLANLGKIPYVISPGTNSAKRSFQSTKIYARTFPLKKTKELHFCPAESLCFTEVYNGHRSGKI